MALRCNIWRDAASAVGLAETPSLKALLGNTDFSSIAQRVLASVTGAMSGVGLAILFLAFLLASQPSIHSKISIMAASSSKEERYNAVLRQVDRGVRDCVLAQTMSGALIATGAGIVMATIGLQNALFWAILIFLISYIPVLGGLAGSVAPALFALGQFQTIWQAVTIFLAHRLSTLSLATSSCPRCRPHIQNIDPAVGILAFSLWSLLWGIPGAILAYPLTLTLMIVFAQFETTRWIAVLISNDGKPAFCLAKADISSVLPEDISRAP